MKKIILLLFFCVLISPSLSQAQEDSPQTLVEQVKSFFRPLVASTLGEQTAEKYFGVELDHLELPEPPELVADARSAKENKVLNENVLDEKAWQRYNLNFVKELYQNVRKSSPNRNDIAQWMNVLDQGGTQEGVYRAMVLDQSYAGLENFSNPVTQEVADFTLWYMDKFNDREYTPDKVEGVNFFSVKRIMTEHSLNTMDGLRERDADDFYRWYAVFSGELARRYPNAFVDELRSHEKMRRHEAWAQKMPEQLVKSEMIIKLHLVFNYLQG